MRVSADKSDSFYILLYSGTYWLTTLATNRQDCWLKAKPFCHSEDWKRELRSEGYRCVRVVMIETLMRAVDVEEAITTAKEVWKG